MTEQNAVVAIHHTHTESETAITKLKRAAFNITKLSIVGKYYHTDEHVVGYYKTGDRMKYWGTLGDLSGRVWGLPLGVGCLTIPGIGPVLIAGPLFGWVLGALDEAVVTGGMTAIGAALYRMGIPKDGVLKYEMTIKSNQFILMAHGAADEAAQARKILQTTQPHSIDTHTPAAETPVSTTCRSAALCTSDQTASIRMREMTFNHEGPLHMNTIHNRNVTAEKSSYHCVCSYGR